MAENKEKTVEELFEELKDDLTFLPDVDAVKNGFLQGLKWNLVQ